MWGRWPVWATAAVVGILASACAGDADDAIDLGGSSPTSTEAVVVTSTTATTSPPSSGRDTPESPEAEVERLIVEWYLAPYDTSVGEQGLEYLTGLMHRRVEERGERLRSEGQILRSRGLARIRVTSVRLDLADGRGEAEFCSGSGFELVDAETLEPIGQPDDPDYLTTSVVLVELTDEGWKISEWYPSEATDDPELCDIDERDDP